MAKESKSTTGRTRQREYRTKELPLKQRIKNYIAENPEATKKQVAKYFDISASRLSGILDNL